MKDLYPDKDNENESSPDNSAIPHTEAKAVLNAQSVAVGIKFRDSGIGYKAQARISLVNGPANRTVWLTLHCGTESATVTISPGVDKVNLTIIDFESGETVTASWKASVPEVKGTVTVSVSETNWGIVGGDKDAAKGPR